MLDKTELHYITQTDTKLQNRQKSDFKQLHRLENSHISLIEIPTSFLSDSTETHIGVLIDVNCDEHNDILLSLQQVKEILDPKKSSDVIEYVFSYSRSESVPCFWCGEMVQPSDSQFQYARKPVFSQHHPTLHKECFETLQEDLNTLSKRNSETLLSYTV